MSNSNGITHPEAATTVEASERAAAQQPTMELGAAHQRLTRAMVDLLLTIRRLDEADAHLSNASSSMTGWLRFDLGLSRTTARAWLRLAHSLADLPRITAAFEAGAISYDAALVLCRYATPENEAMLLPLALEVDHDELKPAIEDLLAMADDPPPEPLPCDRSYLHTGWSDDGQWMHVRGRFYGADGAHLEKVIATMAATAPPDPGDGLGRSMGELQADALVQLASQAAADDPRHDRATLVLHLTTAQLAAETGVRIGGHHISHAEIQRLACDARIQPAIDDPHGITVGVGRSTRRVPPWLRMLLDERDGGCRFPGCNRTRWVHAHHIAEWTRDEGPTNLDNLVLLCGYHHRYIHNHCWTIEGNPNHELRFYDRWGGLHRPLRVEFAAKLKYALAGIEFLYQHRLAELAELAKFSVPAPSPP